MENHWLPSDTSSPMQPQLLRGRYQIIRPLAQGGFAETYLAEDRDRPGSPICVVKRLRPQFSDPQSLQVAERLFNSEAQILEQLGREHSQIPLLLAYFVEADEFYLVQDFIQGQNLGAELFDKKRLTEAEVIEFLHGILTVLAFVHRCNVIHRDIKPDNLIRRESDGKLVLIDFGAVKMIDPARKSAQRFTVTVGTTGYMPNEQLFGQPNLSSDVYAVGVIAIQALTGLCPGTEEWPIVPGTGEIKWRDPVLNPTYNTLSVSPALADFLDKMICSNCQERYQSGGDALQALETLRSPTSSTPLTPSPRQTELSSQHRSKSSPLPNQIPWLVIGLAIPVFVSGIGVALWKGVGVGKLTAYDNSQEGIRTQYPAQWKVNDVRNSIDGTLVKFVPTSGYESQNQPATKPSIEPSITILSQPIPECATESSACPEEANECTSEALEQYAKTETYNLKYNFDVVEEGPIILGAEDCPGYEFTYVSRDSQDRIQRREVWVLKHNRIYILDIEAESDQFDSFSKQAQVVIDSFQIN